MEKYLKDGYLIVIDMAVQNGNPMLASVADRSIVRTSKSAVPLAISYMYPSRNIDIVEEQVFEPLSNMIRGLGIKNGIISFEGIIYKRSCILSKHSLDLGEHIFMSSLEDHVARIFWR